MILRDTLNTKDKYDYLIENYKQFIVEEQKDIEELLQLEDKGLQKFSRPNTQVIKSAYKIIAGYQEEILLASYSAGYSLTVIKDEYIKFIDSLVPVWYNNSRYVQMVWALSIGILLDIDDEVFDKLVDLVRKDDPVDYLIDYLIHYRQPDWKIRDDFMFPRPYVFTEKITQAESSTEASKLLQFYLEKEWYQGQRGHGWYDLHKRNIDNYVGYWSFEAGAICKIMGLNPDDFKEVDYFPYDLVVGED